jgi:N-acetylglucosaminyldiphosphoundecaprenol N-acetyl-beta-D-mannosaminyltransferase
MGSGVVAAMLSILARVLRRRSGRSLSEAATEVLLSTAPLLVAIAGGLLISGLWTKVVAGSLSGAAALMLVGGLSRRQAVISRPMVALLLTVLLASLAAVGLGLRIDAIRHPLSGMPVLTGGLAIPLTVLWLVVFTAAFSTTGRLEGLCLPLAAVASATSLLVLALRQQEVVLASRLSAATAGAAFGLTALALSGLRPPAGNVTAVVLGYLLATTSVVGVSKSSALLSFGIPLILFAVPMLGMTTLVFDRLRMRFLVVEVRQDVYRWLLNRGLPRHRAIVFITCVQAYLGAIVVLLAALRRMPLFASGLIFAACAVAGVPFFGRLLHRLVIPPGQPPEDAPVGTRLLDMKVDPIGMEEALRKIESFIASGRAHHVVTADTPALARAIDDARFRDVVNAAHMVTADGIGVVWAARVLGVPVRDRVPGIDLMEELCRRSAEKGHRVFFLGGEPGVAEEAARRLAARFPGLAVVGTHHGYFAASDEPKVLELIRAARPDILFVALGSPPQDYWIHQHLDDLGVPVCVGVGGSLDVFAGRVHRAPRWMRRLGLEWLYRALHEPWRVRRWTGIPRVVVASLRAKLQSYWS